MSKIDYQALQMAAERAIPAMERLLILPVDDDLLSEQELKGLVELCRENNTHLVLSGRGLPAWLVEEADLISEINEIKHPFYSGQKAQAGIEF